MFPCQNRSESATWSRNEVTQTYIFVPPVCFSDFVFIFLSLVLRFTSLQLSVEGLGVNTLS